MKAFTDEPTVPAADESLSRSIDALAVAVDHLFVAELQRGLADEDTIELIAKALDLAAVARSGPATRPTEAALSAGAATSACAARCADGVAHAGPDDAEVTCSG